MNLNKIIEFTLKKITFYVACTLLLSHVHAGDDLMFDKNRFPHTPMHGTFIVVQTIPDLSNIPASRYYSSVFMPQQRVKFEYDGEVGSDWDGYFEYKMTVFPPYDKRMCSQDDWRHYCNDFSGVLGMPARPITQTIILSASRIKNQKDINESEELIPYGLKLNDYIYGGNTSDGGVVYDSFYFNNWNTLISTTTYSDANLRSKAFSKAKVHTAIQILKRVDENARIAYRPMVR
ncbi:hypothetical protein [Delftia tsuruhatensis]|uniref:hypothetical protein n=1 Tax=Delftia tsuruhatensis TaxID=180282 RepID=UPI001F269503|nr:hypothetical protein [Delftia tsuruhatensis]